MPHFPEKFYHDLEEEFAKANVEGQAAGNMFPDKAWQTFIDTVQQVANNYFHVGTKSENSELCRRRRELLKEQPDLRGSLTRGSTSLDTVTAELKAVQKTMRSVTQS